MRGVFDEEELKPVRRDTELTLGSGMLLGIFFGLVLVCGLCFGLGYAVGHRSPQLAQAANVPETSGGTSVELGSSAAKPSATTAMPQLPAPATTDTEQQPEATGSDVAPTSPVSAGPAPVQTGAVPPQPVVHPALTPAVATTQAAFPATIPNRQVGSGTASSVSQAGGFMVQIAAVSNVEDADVLTSALRRRGYAVTSRRDPADNLIHVRIGPFATPSEANSWKIRLLNDGYNAIVQP